MNALWGVIVGSLLTVMGQGAAELVKARVATKGREEGRDRIRRRFHLDALEELEGAALRLHDVLIEYQSVDVPDELLEKALRESMSVFDACVPRVESDLVRSKMHIWKNTAVRWVNDDDSAAAEQRAWQAALTACGEGMRAEL
ncbi:hypothetical protein SAMN05892883_0371 [Jatrophihabitans sp. GAS493]|uniref:hypothetical protein n=1 Tax=Jatrophihabitans sp. GAS493 TaxID=1907575 RepID=UPI000BB99FD5|nr:hypothetical protein [Jatrophihabitans sp. GAS493]SOD70715.1 hypothetical protein SAMN05892883_0371 [Jatrophihabitans sp. GAS493]